MDIAYTITYLFKQHRKFLASDGSTIGQFNNSVSVIERVCNIVYE